MQKEGFIYIWYDRKRKMYYVGCHWGTINDGYICSSNRMRDAYRRRPQDFKRRIIRRGINKNELLAEETKWLQLIPTELLGKRYYNLNNSFSNIWWWYADDKKKKIAIEKISNGNKGKIQTEETKKKISEASKKLWCKESHKILISGKLKGNKSNSGRHLSETHKTNISNALKGKHFLKKQETVPWNKNIKMGPLTDEHKKKISESLLGNKHTTKTKEAISLKNKGKVPWNKGRKNVYNEETKLKMSQSAKNRKKK